MEGVNEGWSEKNSTKQALVACPSSVDRAQGVLYAVATAPSSIVIQANRLCDATAQRGGKCFMIQNPIFLL